MLVVVFTGRSQSTLTLLYFYMYMYEYLWSIVSCKMNLSEQFSILYPRASKQQGLLSALQPNSLLFRYLVTLINQSSNNQDRNEKTSDIHFANCCDIPQSNVIFMQYKFCAISVSTKHPNYASCQIQCPQKENNSIFFKYNVDFIFHLIHHYLFPLIVLVGASQEILWAFKAYGNNPSKNYTNK